MAYFKHFDTIKYNGIDTVNIMNSVISRQQQISKSSYYYYYTLLDGEQPEDVSFKEYKDTGYWWILLAINNVVDPYHDWLMSSQCLESFMESKYGDGLYGIHHFESLESKKHIDGYHSAIYQALLDNDQPIPHNVQAISNREYEIQLNEEKRNIKVISSEYIRNIQDEFEKLMDERQETTGIIK